MSRSEDEERRRLERRARLGDEDAKRRLKRAIERGAPLHPKGREPVVDLGDGWYVRFDRKRSGVVAHESDGDYEVSDWIQYDDRSVLVGWDWPERIPGHVKVRFYELLKSLEALVIVHPSSIDSFAWNVGQDEAEELLSNIALAVNEHPGPVIVIDQGWTERLARRLRDEIRHFAKNDLVWIHFDEDEEPWSALWPKLSAALEEVGARSAWVAGLWWSNDLESGCATTVYNHLREIENIPTRADDGTVLGEEP